MDDEQLAEEFGYSNVTLQNTFDDDEYVVDISGLHLADEDQLAVIPTCYVDDNINMNAEEDLFHGEYSGYETCDDDLLDNSGVNDSSDNTTGNESLHSGSEDNLSDGISGDDSSEESSGNDSTGGSSGVDPSNSSISDDPSDSDDATDMSEESLSGSDFSSST